MSPRVIRVLHLHDSDTLHYHSSTTQPLGLAGFKLSACVTVYKCRIFCIDSPKVQ